MLFDGVKGALFRVFTEVGGMTGEQANEKVNNMQKEGRLQIDVYWKKYKNRETLKLPYYGPRYRSVTLLDWPCVRIVKGSTKVVIIPSSEVWLEELSNEAGPALSRSLLVCGKKWIAPTVGWKAEPPPAQFSAFFFDFFPPTQATPALDCTTIMAETTKFYGNPICPFAHRAWWAAKEKGVPLEFVHIPLGDEKPEWYVVASLLW